MTPYQVSAVSQFQFESSATTARASSSGSALAQARVLARGVGGWTDKMGGCPVPLSLARVGRLFCRRLGERRTLVGRLRM